MWCACATGHTYDTILTHRWISVGKLLFWHWGCRRLPTLDKSSIHSDITNDVQHAHVRIVVYRSLRLLVAHIRGESWAKVKVRFVFFFFAFCFVCLTQFTSFHMRSCVCLRVCVCPCSGWVLVRRLSAPFEVAIADSVCEHQITAKQHKKWKRHFRDCLMTKATATKQKYRRTSAVSFHFSFLSTNSIEFIFGPFESNLRIDTKTRQTFLMLIHSADGIFW